MTRNTNSHFATNPTNIDISRSRFNRDSSIKTSFNTGDVVPFYVEEVLPGDTFSVKTSKVVRMQSLLTPVMDNLYLDTYYFFVPNRLTWSHWREFCGENTQSAWIPETEYTIPQITSPASGWDVGTIADYMGLPTGVANLSVSALPFRAYALIMDQWFRDENLMDPLNIPVDDATIAGSNGSTAVTDVVKGGKPYVATKFRDYFTSALPSPQKGPDVLIPSATAGQYPVVTLQTFHDPGEYSIYGKIKRSDGTFGTYSLEPQNTPSGTSGQSATYRYTSDPASATLQSGFLPTNLYALAEGGLGATINQLRMAFQVQKLYEKDARGGTRYIELLKAHFGVTSPDARLQRPEYLGGNRIPITINQVLQQSQSTDSSPQGNPTGQSLTTDSHGDFSKSFVEHGFIIGVMVARYDHTYQQGISRMWSRKGRFEYYWPVLANIGEQAIKNKEIFAAGTASDDEVFGYQEAWAEYRYRPNMVTGEMRSAYTQSLDSWHFADDYSQLPSLSPSWIVEDKTNVDRVLAVQSSVANQLFADIYVQNKCTRAMPLYSIPGLIDHH